MPTVLPERLYLPAAGRGGKAGIYKALLVSAWCKHCRIMTPHRALIVRQGRQLPGSVATGRSEREQEKRFSRFTSGQAGHCDHPLHRELSFLHAS